MIVTGLPRFRRGAIVPQIKTFAPKSRNADAFFITIFVYKGQLHLDAFTVPGHHPPLTTRISYASNFIIIASSNSVAASTLRCEQQQRQELER